MKIQLREYITRKPNGDRDPTPGTDCSDYEVVLINGKKETVLKSFNGFDDFWTSHHDPIRVRKDAEKYLASQRDFFDAEEIPAEKFRPAPPKPQPTVWQKV